MKIYECCTSVTCNISNPAMWTHLVANSTPMVVLLSAWNSFLVKRERRLVFPTPESPTRTTIRRHFFFNPKKYSGFVVVFFLFGLVFVVVFFFWGGGGGGGGGWLYFEEVVFCVCVWWVRGGGGRGWGVRGMQSN